LAFSSLSSSKVTTEQKNLGKNFPSRIFFPNFSNFTPTFEPVTLESQLKAQKTHILA